MPPTAYHPAQERTPGAAASMTDSSVEKSSQYQGKTEKVKHLPQIIGLLRRLRDNRVLLSVRVPGHDGVFNSLLLEVDPERNIILLDELNPRQGHELVAQVGQIRIRCQCHGIELSFACAVQIGQGREGISFYQAALPDSINYLQRRRDYRVRVAFDMSIPVQLPCGSDDRVDGQLFDVSVGGVGFNVHLDTPLERGQILEHCRIELPQGETIETPLKVRFVRSQAEQKLQRVGAAFMNLLPREEQRIRRFVTHLEREMLRRKARR